MVGRMNVRKAGRGDGEAVADVWLHVGAYYAHLDPSHFQVPNTGWRRGAGRALLETAEAWGRDRGAEAVRLDTWAESPVSVPFCERGMATADDPSSTKSGSDRMVNPLGEHL